LEKGFKRATDSALKRAGGLRLDRAYTDVSKLAGVADQEGSFGLGVAWRHFNEDGYIDLYVANDTGANYLYQNKGDGTFSEIDLMSGKATPLTI